MTDITDQDRRDAREWAEDVAETFKYDDEVPRETRAAVNYILATVDAPEPTLADEIRGLPDFTMSGENCINDCHERADTIATSVDHMERDLTEVRAEVERLVGHLHTAEHNHAFAAEKWTQMEKERDEARAEVDRLTAELNTHSETHSHTETHSVNEVTDPADVKPGEAWLVEVEGERRNAVKGRADGEPWNTFTADGWYLSEDNERITLVSRLVPAPRVITNPDELDRAKRRTVIQDTDGIVCERALLGDGWFVPGIRIDQTPCIKLPVMVLWEPEA